MGGPLVPSRRRPWFVTYFIAFFLNLPTTPKKERLQQRISFPTAAVRTALATVLCMPRTATQQSIPLLFQRPPCKY